MIIRNLASSKNNADCSEVTVTDECAFPYNGRTSVLIYSSISAKDLADPV